MRSSKTSDGLVGVKGIVFMVFWLYYCIESKSEVFSESSGSEDEFQEEESEDSTGVYMHGWIVKLIIYILLM